MGNKVKIYKHLTISHSVVDIIENPAFEGFGKLILPKDNADYSDDILIKNIKQLLPYHSNIDSNIVVNSLNRMIDDINDGKTVFYNFYDKYQQKKDVRKESTGLFFYRGKPKSPFAVVCPGGGFSYVGSLHEGFPYAVKISEQGYNVFVLKYRVGSWHLATEDLAAAISFIIKNSDLFEVDVRNYSLWGSSAGARMVANIGSFGVTAYGGDNLQKPCMIVMAYTGYQNFTKKDPPTFIVTGEDDRIVPVSTAEQRVLKMRKAGIDVEYHKYKNVGHGFGLGTGTNAEGWINLAIQFWKDKMSK